MAGQFASVDTCHLGPLRFTSLVVVVFSISEFTIPSVAEGHIRPTHTVEINVRAPRGDNIVTRQQRHFHE